MASFAEFKTKMMPYAITAKQGTGIPHDVILIQWSNESGNGTSVKAKQNNNYGGIKWSKYGFTSGKDSGGFATYGSIDQFVQDYIRVMKLSYYDKVRSVGATGDIAGTIKALGESPYDAGHYLLGGVQGGKLLNAMGLLPSGGGSATDEKKTVKLQCPSCSAPLQLSRS